MKKSALKIILFALFLLASLVTYVHAHVEPLLGCGYYTLDITMEQVPVSWDEYSKHSDYMTLYNQYMDVFRSTPSDGTWSLGNGDNEFAGYVDNATLYDEYGEYWDSNTIAQVIYYWDCECCEITESDLAFNPAYTFTMDRDVAEDNPTTHVYYDSVLLHELGHVWGMQKAHEIDYHYDKPTVMHAYNSSIVQDHMQIHVPEARIIRRLYDDQKAIPSLTNMSIISKYADGTTLHWENSITDSISYTLGDRISVYDVTVENTGTTTLSDVHVQFYLSSNRTISAQAGTLIGEWYWPSFSSESYTILSVENMQIPAGIVAGDYYVGAIVTYNGHTQDSFIEDNTTHLWGTITVDAPDLIVESITTSPSSVYKYDAVNVTVRVKNQGNAPSASFYMDFYKDLVLPPPLNQAGDFRCDIAGLAAGDTYDCTGIVAYSSTGSHTMWARVDRLEDIAESDETNNVKSKNINIEQRTLDVISPSSFQVNYAGELIVIAWNSSGIGNNVKIEVCHDGCTIWQTIAESTENDGLFFWYVPPDFIGDFPSFIVVSSVDYPEIKKYCDCTLSLKMAELTVTSLNDGETLTVGDYKTITWEALGGGTLAKFELSRDNGSSWETVKDYISCCQYSWKVTEPPTDIALIRLTSTQYSSVSDTNDAVFSIQLRPSITVTSPKYDTWIVGETHDIKWTSVNAGEVVKIELSRDGEATWETISDKTENDGVYSWLVTGSTNLTTYGQKIRIATPEQVMGMSSGFAITSELHTLSVALEGTGSGSVWDRVGILCGTSCAADYPYGRELVLRATPWTGSIFAGWGGDPDCTDGTVTMTGNINCTATFLLDGTDSDGDGVPDDGDNSSIIGDNPCTGGNISNCDDNCVNIPNPDQADFDNNGVGDACYMDVDGDGIFNEVDMQPTSFSSFFSDIYFGNSNEGFIIDRGDQNLEITEAASLKEILIKAPTGGASPATISACNGMALITLDQGDEAILKCSSVTVDVVNGSAEIEYMISNTPYASVNLSVGNGLTFDPSSLTATALPDNTDTVTVIVGASNIPISAGETRSLVPDNDGDGYNSIEVGGNDCNDFNDNINPGVQEVINDGVDNDCNPATPIVSVSGVGMNTPSAAKWRASMAVNANETGPSGLVKYYYTRQRVEFTSSSITSVTAERGIAVVSGRGDATRITGSSSEHCYSCSFTATMKDSDTYGDAMHIEIIGETIDGYFSFNSPGGLLPLDNGDFKVKGK